MARARFGKKIDFKQWTVLPGKSVSHTTDGTNIASTGGLAFTSPSTILRVRCPEILQYFDESRQVGDGIVLTYGLGVVTTDAVAAGDASMPDPQSEPEFPWVYWTQVTLRGEITSMVEAEGTSSVRLRDIDSRAMRKMHPGQSLVWVLQRTGAFGAPVTLVTVADTRVLIGT